MIFHASLFIRSLNRISTSLLPSFSLPPGCLWYLNVKLDQVIHLFKSKTRLIDFLLLRRDSKMTILTVCKQLLGPSTSPAPLPVVARIFDRLNECYRVHVDQEQQQGPGAAGGAAQWFVDSEFHNSRKSLDAGKF